MQEFTWRYAALEKKLRKQAAADNVVYLPNMEPPGPVDFVFIAMEPSLGGWAQDVKDAQQQIETGFRNFSLSIWDFILHFAIREFVCNDDVRSYHITDISKGPMPVERARVDRKSRWEAWYPLLREEIAIVAKPTARIFAVGRKAERFLNTQNPRLWPMIEYCPHYSPQNGAEWKRWRDGLERSFGEFSRKDWKSGVVANAKAVLTNAHLPNKLVSRRLAALERVNFGHAQDALLFAYAQCFEARPSSSTGHAHRPAQRSKSLTPKQRVISVVGALRNDANLTDALRALHRAFPKEMEARFNLPGGGELRRLLENEKETKAARPNS